MNECFLCEKTDNKNYNYLKHHKCVIAVCVECYKYSELMNRFKHWKMDRIVRNNKVVEVN